MTIKTIIEEFDRHFGTADLSDSCGMSSGRKAGCDDCSDSQKLRQEHRDFLESQLSTLLDEIEKKGIDLSEYRQ